MSRVAASTGSGRPHRPVRLINALALASALPLTVLTVAIGAMNWWNGQRSAEALANGLGRGISEQVRIQLDQLLASPRQVNSLNARAIAEGRLNPDNLDQLARTFVSQMEVFPVGYINYGNQQGDYVGIERLADGSLQLNLTDRRLGVTRQYVYAIGPNGPSSQPLQIYDPIPSATQEAWYRETVAARGAIWSSIYQWDDKPEVLSVSYNEPVLYPDGRLRGVIGIDFTLAQLNSKLAEIWGKRPGLVLITERNGLLVASSSGRTTDTRPGHAPRRRRIDQGNNQLEREASQLLFLPTAAGTGLRLDEALVRGNRSEPTTHSHSTSSTFIQALPWSDQHGLNWLVLVIIPKQTLTAAIEQQTMLTTVLGLASLIVLLLASNRVTRWILSPLEDLSEGARQLGESIRRSPGAPLQFAPGSTRGSAEEIETLGSAFDNLIGSFNGLIAALRRTGNRLQRELEQKATALDLATRREREALQASAARERFLGHLGRELIQPVADLRGATRLARLEHEPGRLERQLDRVDAAARRLERLARTLRDHARLADGALVVQSAPVELALLLESTTEELRPAARSRNLGLSWAIAPGTPQAVQGDGERLRQVLDHLVARVIRAGRPPGIRLEASPLAEGTAAWVRLRIEGSGEDSDRLSRALCGVEPVPCPSDPDQLTDLGLSVCRQLLALMGASAAVEQRAGEGTSLTLHLPAGSDRTA